MTATSPFSMQVLEFSDGPQFMVHFPELEEYAVQFHRATGVIVHGGEISTRTGEDGQDTYQLGQRSLGLCPDRATFLMVLTTITDAHSEVDGSDEAKEQFQMMLAALKARAVPAEQTDGPQPGRKALTMRVRVGNGVPVHLMPLGPWTATDREIRDRTGAVVYVRPAQALDTPPAAAQDDTGMLGGLRKLFRLGNPR